MLIFRGQLNFSPAFSCEPGKRFELETVFTLEHTFWAQKRMSKAFFQAEAKRCH
jgi:hypothetical protein